MFGIDFDRVLGRKYRRTADTQRSRIKSNSRSHIVLLGLDWFSVAATLLRQVTRVNSALILVHCVPAGARRGLSSRRSAAGTGPQFATVSLLTISSATASAR